MQRSQDVTGLPVRDELRIQDNPQHDPSRGDTARSARNTPLINSVT
jgi:hypothetical protein